MKNYSSLYLHYCVNISNCILCKQYGHAIRPLPDFV